MGRPRFRAGQAKAGSPREAQNRSKQRTDRRGGRAGQGPRQLYETRRPSDNGLLTLGFRCCYLPLYADFGSVGVSPLSFTSDPQSLATLQLQHLQGVGRRRAPQAPLSGNGPHPFPLGPLGSAIVTKLPQDAEGLDKVHSHHAPHGGRELNFGGLCRRRVTGKLPEAFKDTD